MALVDYTSSDDESTIETTTASTKTADQVTGRKRKHDIHEAENLPPLPSKFHDLYASNTRVSTGDDPSLHAGRTRATPHVVGNWPTHVYIECTFPILALLL